MPVGAGRFVSGLWMIGYKQNLERLSNSEVEMGAVHRSEQFKGCV